MTTIVTKILRSTVTRPIKMDYIFKMKSFFRTLCIKPNDLCLFDILI